MLRDEYETIVRHFSLDIEHLDQQLSREDDPRECASLRRLRAELVDKRAAYWLALESMKCKKDSP